MSTKSTRPRLALVLALTISLTACASHQSVNVTPGQPTQPRITPDDVLAGAKTFGGILADALGDAVVLKNQLVASGVIDRANEPAITQWLESGQRQTADFNSRLAKYQHFDTDSRVLIANFITEALGFVESANANGILHIKNPQSQLIATGILFGAKAAIRTFRGTFAKVQ